MGVLASSLSPPRIRCGTCVTLHSYTLCAYTPVCRRRGPCGPQEHHHATPKNPTSTTGAHTSSTASISNDAGGANQSGTAAAPEADPLKASSMSSVFSTGRSKPRVMRVGMVQAEGHEGGERRGCTPGTDRPCRVYGMSACFHHSQCHCMFSSQSQPVSSACSHLNHSHHYWRDVGMPSPQRGGSKVTGDEYMSAEWAMWVRDSFGSPSAAQYSTRFPCCNLAPVHVGRRARASTCKHSPCGVVSTCRHIGTTARGKGYLCYPLVGLGAQLPVPRPR